MTAVWIPPVDRSKFMANMMASSLGAAATMPICGLLIEYISWESVFYVTGKKKPKMVLIQNSSEKKPNKERNTEKKTIFHSFRDCRPLSPEFRKKKTKINKK